MFDDSGHRLYQFGGEASGTSVGINHGRPLDGIAVNLVEGVTVGVAFKLHLDANVGDPGTLVIGKVADAPGGRNINVAFDINFDCGKGNATVGGKA